MTLLCAVAPALVLSISPAVQVRTDFSGTWNLDESRSVTATYDTFVRPVVWTIRQSDTELTVDVTRGPKSFVLVYKLYQKRPLGAATEGVPSFVGYWDGERLITETTQSIQGQTVITHETRWLQAGGREMVVERLVKVEHGYTLRGAQSYNTAKDVFVKTTP